MGGTTVTISLRADEVKAIKDHQIGNNLTRHEIIKWALRRYLFPKEQTVPLNGRTAQAPPSGHFNIPHNVEPSDRIEIT
jgi:hypothetical protein